MIRLHGVTISNYYASVKLALLEKGVAFEEVAVFPSQKPEVLAASPMGKVPWLELDGTTLSETNVIYDYLEETRPQPPLYPAAPLARAKAREIIRIIELYIDLPARRHINSVYFGAAVDAVAFEQARPAVANGLAALARVARFSPWIAGEHFGYADITAYFELRFANLCTRRIYDWDIIDGDPALRDYIARLGARPSVAEVDGVMQAAMDKLLAKT